jgi:predicted amidohydrolase
MRIAAAQNFREELIQAEISEDAVKSVRSQMQVFAHRRHDLYK